MRTVRSCDGTTIAYDRYGEGPAVILVGGALSHRRFKKMVALAKLLSERCTVINYDRRGRGDSDEAGPFAVQREIEDIAALIDAAGGRASVWGWSSGGALALRAVGADIGVQRLSVYEAPFMVDRDGKLPTEDYSQRLDELVAAGDRGGAVKHFMKNAIRIPSPFVGLMPLMPIWKELKANALTLPYDWAALGEHNMQGNPLEPAEWASVTVPTLIVHGTKSPINLKHGSRALAATLPNAELRLVAGTHNFKLKLLAPVLAEFFAGGEPGHVPASGHAQAATAARAPGAGNTG
jgi:pimeloyl-ACP methyl ester carboxylesterase